MFSKIKKFVKYLFAERITVRVTALDIKYGQRGKAFRCPIALALKDMGYNNPAVGTDVIIPDIDTFGLPKNAQDFIKNFDKGLPVKPFTFTATKNN